MKKNSFLNVLIIVLGLVVLFFACYFLFLNKKDISFVINEKKIQLKIGETKKIGYQISDNSLNITWTSNSDLVTVNNNGEIKAIDYGDAIITGTVEVDDKKYSSTCLVTSYSGDIGVNISRIEEPNGYILMKTNSEMDIPINIVPTNAYITDVNYSVEDDSVAIIENKKIKSIKQGTTTIKVEINKNNYISLNIRVSDNVKENTIAKEIDKVLFKEKDVTMEIGATKTLLYDINPTDGYVDNIKWNTSDSSIVSVNNGEIKGIGSGNAIVKVVINDKIEDTINVKVNASNANIIVDYNPKTLIRIGEKTVIKSHIDLENVNEEIKYSSSNSNVATVNNGEIIGVSTGSTKIMMSLSNGKKKYFDIRVLPNNGLLNSDSYFWGYKSLNAKVPVLAKLDFFQRLAHSGIGVINDYNYIITTSDGTYTYDINASLLIINNQKIKFRMYYPENEDLSTLNTLVYMGGRGEKNFDGYFSKFDEDPSMIKSAGIVGLVAEGYSFDGESGSYATKFIKAITKQKNGVNNSILGFSDGAHKVLHAANYENYKTIVIFSGYVDGASKVENAKNKEVIFIIASGDANYSQAKSALNNMINSGYKSVTMVSNGNDLTNYSNRSLIIQVGNLIKNGHYSENVLTSGIIEYAND